MSQVPVTFQQLAPALIEQLQGMLRGETGDVTPEATAAKDAAVAAQDTAVAAQGVAQQAAADATGVLADAAKKTELAAQTGAEQVGTPVGTVQDVLDELTSTNLTINAANFGASPSATWQANRDAFQGAANAAFTRGGGRVIAPTGVYQAKGIVLDSRVVLDLSHVTLTSPDGLSPNVISTRQYDKSGSASGNILTLSDVTNVEIGSACAVQYAGGILESQVTTLTGNIDSSQTSGLVLTSVTELAQSGVLQVGTELIQFTSRSGGTLVGVTRGAFGSAAAAHTTAEPIGIARRHYALVVGVSGTSVEIDSEVELPVTGAQVSFGVVGAGVVGRGMVDGNKVSGGAPTSVYGLWMPLARGCVVDVRAQNTDQGGVMLTRGACDNRVVYAGLRDCGSPSASKGSAFWLYQGCRRNRIDEIYVTGEAWVAIYLDDRTSTNEEGWDAPNEGNVFVSMNIDMTNPNSSFTAALNLVSSSRNRFLGGYIRTNGVGYAAAAGAQGVGSFLPSTGNDFGHFVLDCGQGWNFLSSGNILHDVFVTANTLQTGASTGVTNYIYATSVTPGALPSTSTVIKAGTSSGSPGIAVDGDPNTGIYSDAPDVIGLSAGAISVLRGLTTELRIFGGTTTIHSSGYTQINSMAGNATPPLANMSRTYLRQQTGGRLDQCVVFPNGNIGITATDSPISIANATDATSVIDQLNTLLAVLRSNGVLAP